MHLAASKASGESMLTLKNSQNNIIGGINLLNACCESEVRTFVFSSSAAIMT